MIYRKPTLSILLFILLSCWTHYCVSTATQQKNERVFSFSLRRGLEDHGLFNINLWNKRNFRRKFIGLILRHKPAHITGFRQRNQNLNFLTSFNVREWEREGGRDGWSTPKYFINKIYWGQIPFPGFDNSNTAEVITERDDRRLVSHQSEQIFPWKILRTDRQIRNFSGR